MKQDKRVSLLIISLIISTAFSSCGEKGADSNESTRLAKEIETVSLGRGADGAVSANVYTKSDSDLKANMLFEGTINPQESNFFDLESQGDDYDLEARLKCDKSNSRCEENLLVFDSKNTSFPGQVSISYNSYYSISLSEVLSIGSGTNRDEIFQSLATDLKNIKGAVGTSSYGNRLLLASINSVNRHFYSYSLFINETPTSAKVYQFRGEVGESEATVLQYVIQNGLRSSTTLSKTVGVDAKLSTLPSDDSAELTLNFVRNPQQAWLDISQIKVKATPGGFSTDVSSDNLQPQAFDFLL